MDTAASQLLAGHAPELLTHYGLAANRTIPLPGWNNPVVRVETANGTFALRWHKQRDRSETQIRAELALLQALMGSSVRVPQPVLTLERDVLLGSNGDFYDLTRWLPGSVRRRDLEPSDACTLGLTLAELHVDSSALNLSPALPHHLEPFSVKGEVSMALLEPYFPAEDCALIHDIERQANLIFREKMRQSGSVGVIHNDFILGNCLWQGSRLSVLDFADCGVGLYLYDLAPMLTNLEAPELQDAFLAGYSSKRPLSEGDNQRLPLLQAVRHVRACLVSIAKAQRNEPIPPLEVHLASRMTDIHTLMV